MKILKVEMPLVVNSDFTTIIERLLKPRFCNWWNFLRINYGLLIDKKKLRTPRKNGEKKKEI